MIGRSDRRGKLSPAILVVLAALTSACGMDAGGSMGKVDGYTESVRKAEESRAAGNYEFAIPLYDRALQMNPKGIEAKSGLAQVYLAIGAPNEAAALYRDLLGRETGNDARRGLALSLIAMGQPMLAERQLDEALKYDSRDYKTVNVMGVSLDMQGRHEDAQARYRQGLEIQPDNVALHCNLGLSLAITGDTQGGLAQLVPLAAGKASDARIRQNLALTYALAGDIANALRMSRGDMGEVAAQRQLSYFIRLRTLPVAERSAAMRRNPAFFPQQSR